MTASPLTANGLVYFQAENGDVLVINPGKSLEIVARNSIGATRGEIFRASLSPIQGQLFIRSRSIVYCVGEPAR